MDNVVEGTKGMRATRVRQSKLRKEHSMFQTLANNTNSNPKETVCEDVKPIQDSIRRRALVNTIV
jgi:hypothetical protein